MGQEPDTSSDKFKDFLSANKKQIISGLILILTFVILFMAQGPVILFLDSQEATHFSERQKQVQMDRSNSGIRIIQITDGANNFELNKLFGKKPYTRDIHGFIIRFLNRTTPKSVIYNISFSLGKDKNPEYDLAFTNAVKAAHYRFVTGLNTINQKPSEKIIGTLFDFLLRIRADVTGFPNDKYLPPSQENLLQFREDGINYFHNVGLPLPNLINDGVSEFATQQTIASDSTKTVRFARLFSANYGHDPERCRIDEKTGSKVCTNTVYLHPTIILSPVMDKSRKITMEQNGNLLVGEKKHLIDVKNEKMPIIRWYGDVRNERVYPIYTEWDIIKSQIIYECDKNPGLAVCKDVDISEQDRKSVIDPDVFKDQNVLIGFRILNEDAHKTVYGSNYPGIFITANIMDNILHNDFVGRTGIPWTVGTSVLLALLIAPLCLRHSIIVSLVLTILMGGVYTLITYHTYTEYGLWVNWIYPITTLVASASLSYIYRILVVEKEKDELAVRINIDPLTKLYNKGYFLETLSTQLDAVKTLNSYLACIFVDLDHFKKLNDTYGHQFGDEVLIAAGEKMKETAATFEEFNVCRYGGEEITVIIAGKPPEQVDAIALKMCEELRTLRFEKHPEVRITASFGVSTIHFTADKKHHDKTMDRIIELADQEVYRSKMNGRDQISCNATGEVQGELLEDAPREGEEPAQKPDTQDTPPADANVAAEQGEQRLKSALQKHLDHKKDLTLPESHYMAHKDASLEKQDSPPEDAPE